MNDIDTDYGRMTSIPLEYYGFLKPRMWDQYGDNYKGVCLALSLSGLKKKSDFVHDKIKYISYNELQFNHFSININDLIESGFDSYNRKLFNKLKLVLFRKHQDYRGECEYRFCSFSKNDYDFIDIKNSIVGIIISEKYISDEDLNKIHEFATSYEVEVIGVDWNESGVSVYPNRRGIDNGNNNQSKINNLKERINFYKQLINGLENLKQYGYLQDSDIDEYKIKLKILEKQIKKFIITSIYSTYT